MSEKAVKKKRRVKVPRYVATVYCNGGMNAKKKYEYEEEVLNCQQALEIDPEGNLECSYGCLGFESCVQACKFDAIHKNENGVPEVDEEKCIHCKLCIKACPRDLIKTRMADQTMMPLCSNQDKGALARKECDVSCIACRMCEKNCPADAIHVIDNYAVIDDDTCLVCGKCVTVCPRKLIKDENGIIYA